MFGVLASIGRDCVGCWCRRGEPPELDAVYRKISRPEPLVVSIVIDHATPHAAVHVDVNVGIGAAHPAAIRAFDQPETGQRRHIFMHTLDVAPHAPGHFCRTMPRLASNDCQPVTGDLSQSANASVSVSV